MEKLVFDPVSFFISLIPPSVPILIVAQDGVAFSRQMGPDLMTPPSDQVYLEKCHFPTYRQRRVFRLNGKRSLLLFVQDTDLIVPLILGQVPSDMSLLLK